MKTILVVEDNAEMRENIAEILELSDYKVLTAENGKVGAAKAKSEKPDLIICDIMMPELDGYGMLYVLNKSQETAKIPFIFLTAKAEKDDFRKGMSMGADDYLTKPFSDMELMSAIELRLKKVEAYREGASSAPTGNPDLLPSNALDKLKEQAKERLINRKDVLYREGDNASHLYYIQSGKIKIMKTNEFGKDYIAWIYKTGDYMGFEPLLENRVHGESAVAIENSTLLAIGKKDFLDHMHTQPGLSAHFVRLLAENIADYRERLLHLAYNSVRKRVAQAILYLNTIFVDDSGEPIPISVTREEIANIVGTSVETVIRTISDFKSENLVSLAKNNHIVVEDAETLANMRN